MMGKIRSIWTHWQVNQVRKKIASLSQAELLRFMLNPESGLGIEDCDGLVQLTFENYPEGETRESIIQRISANFILAQKEQRRIAK